MAEFLRANYSWTLGYTRVNTNSPALPSGWADRGTRFIRCRPPSAVVSKVRSSM